MSEGLEISITPSIRSFILSSASSGDVSALSASQTKLRYADLRSVWTELPPESRPSLKSLLRGSDFVFSSPEPRHKSEELKARLRKLAEMQEQREYAELVKDVAPKKDEYEPFSSYKDQIGFGLHVVAVMFTGYLVGYATFRALFNHNPIMNAAGGILGLVGGMLLETVLFIIRASNQDMKANKSSSNSRVKIKKQ
ncbi:hypothetical protein LUZ60_014266 [Juncus effusus]|nr:hypothetical protein LUZ60_014266 [Juncus effusus]